MVRMGQGAAFELSDLGQPATMSFCTAKPGAEEVLRAIPCDRDAHGSPSKAKYIHVIVLHPLAGRKVIVTERRAPPDNLICSHGGAHTAAAH